MNAKKEKTMRELHQTKYAQFVTESVLKMVRKFLEGKTVDIATDPHLNTIPLAQWDSLAGIIARGSQITDLRTFPSDSVNLIRLHIGQVSPCDKICTLKEAARQILEGKK